ncbi:4-hydroxy-3-methylbut-2-en-1-yl diphosphate synthase (ferredoxin), chloroplastic [Dendrobium catenatum]|uniref:4-hydroxy-3-methylbut-2-en-1-yl diphosphate synthase (ferredoxin), chloroplastic n=1 Tax=Dendrobium nobile TaxID=94219 RepID=A0A7T0FXN7_DENNO|nr:4-hydroxy-3-methylbut-2-en-1-yl diphosphate synthase (ferredoxin), chloroplastic [Dendrobium catenatum]XP_020689849.1 4-hydroxy-3-methylbut-2-en-1-yl diphosphate synthase (ferredoxin), chloroplastic [Dendrobium catenatum]XP_028557198.1 4-hydroxy-3-methylbut-2-en-1-yl diphosphate synthase (ferredoxin), chloroplastic [Dendrobium catenatum]QPJ58132.1 chloroplastic 4-hydroxy-3-methylbut-2-en-1-yl diphosphate synthase (ferredoxin) [Dendrobium nobile]QPJ58133.1 chloroplastic 4-hydroxy-3-methylbut-
MMVAGTISTCFPTLKGTEYGLSFAKTVDFAKIASDPNSKKSWHCKSKVFMIRNSSSGSETVELQPASEGSPLLVPRQKYCESVHKTVRRKTRTVMVGNVALGSQHPIRIQTMTTSDTKDVAKTVEEVMRIADKGADIVRITVQGKREADACFEIKNSLVQNNYNIPLVADIHFAPSVALRVAECFDKIRVNPGNFADRRAQFVKLEYDEEDYQKELEHIEEVFSPLVDKCKKYGRAMRIGTNHGSLSDRIMSYYGDSPRGMVESAFEFARICRKLDFHNFIFSMKASNPVIMVQAYRLLVAEMYVQGWDYPLHLGVTEAGEGEDGRMKSAIGIGTLLQDGLGDTIRVSLTEPPEEEIDPCRKLASLGMRAANIQKGVAPFEEKNRRYFDFQRRSGQLPVQKEGDEVDYRGVLHRDGSVLMSVSLDKLKTPELLYRSLAAKLVVGMPFKDLATVDSILLKEVPPVDDADARLALKRLIDISMGILVPLSEQLTRPLQNAIVLVNLKELSTGAYKLLPEGTRLAVTVRGDERYEELDILMKVADITMLLQCLPYSEEKVGRVHSSRRLFEYLQENSLNFPVIHHLQFPDGTERDDLVIGAGSEAGALLVDGLGDGILIEAQDHDFDFLRDTSFNLLQGCRMRNTKTEYVSCPSCGRTLFDLQDISAQIREKTSHLPGVSIAIMGCIVNGPGEMADADFGYVGGAPGKIDLYVGKTVVKRGIAMEGATEALIQLIKDHDRWVDPPAEE